MSVAKKPWSVEQVARYRPWVFGLCLYPVFRWVWFAFTNQLTANPPEFLIRSTGLWALVGLCLTLSITPLRRFLHQPALLRFRRMLGLFTFFYTVLHVLAWGYWERGWSLNAMWQDI